MSDICFYFQVHQPFRLRKDFDFFAIGKDEEFEDVATNAAILRKVADRCYLPANALLLELIERHRGRFRVAFSISGVALEQFALYDPRVIDSFRALAATGCVEFLGETYYHSLAFVFSLPEFKRQVRLHAEALARHLGVTPRTFRNTELIYNDELARTVETMGYDTIVAEGADRVLGWRSPAHLYRPAGTHRINLLLKNYRLSDDIAFRFGAGLTAAAFVDAVEREGARGPLVNLFMDYETFGEHQAEASGIFAFLRHLPDEALRRGIGFVTPGEASRSLAPVAELAMPDFVSWADTERDTSAWLGNHLQNAATAGIYGLEAEVLATGDAALVHQWAKLQTSDHFYYMCTKFFADGDVHKYFNPYESPYDAFVFFANALSELRWRLKEKACGSGQDARTRSAPLGMALA